MEAVRFSSGNRVRHVMGELIFLENFGGVLYQFFFINPFIVIVWVTFPFSEVLSGSITLSMVDESFDFIFFFSFYDVRCW